MVYYNKTSIHAATPFIHATHSETGNSLLSTIFHTLASSSIVSLCPYKTKTGKYPITVLQIEFSANSAQRNSKFQSVYHEDTKQRNI